MTDTEIQTALVNVPDWALIDGKKIKREFEFKNFRKAFAFMTESALVCEKLDHHPNWSNTYNKVVVEIFTHTKQALTELDFKLAKSMSDIFKNYNP